MFCMLLRKHCEGGQIEAIRQIGMERIIHMDIRQRDELGDLNIKTIIIELMGRHSNIILTDTATGTIHDGIHHVTPAISSFRIVMPGTAYAPPPDQGKANPRKWTVKSNSCSCSRIRAATPRGDRCPSAREAPAVDLQRLQPAALSRAGLACAGCNRG